MNPSILYNAALAHCDGAVLAPQAIVCFFVLPYGERFEFLLGKDDPVSDAKAAKENASPSGLFANVFGFGPESIDAQPTDQHASLSRTARQLREASMHIQAQLERLIAELEAVH